MTLNRSSNWQPKLYAPGEIVSDLDDIAQCIQVILTTPRGSDPLRPEFASDLWKYLDWPIDRALPHIVREAVEAITLWEPRVELIRVQPRLGNDPGHWVLRVDWRYHGTQQSSEVRL